MTLHTPVVLTDDDTVAAEARDRNWPVVRREDGVLRLTGVSQTAPLPEQRMDIASGSLSEPTAGGWKFVLDWVVKHVHRPMLVTAPDSWASDLARWACVSRGWPLRLVQRLDELPRASLLEERGHGAPSPSPRTPGMVRVLLVAHDPSTARARLWLAAARSTQSLQVDLATAVPGNQSDRVHVVPDLGTANLAPGTGTLDPVPALVLELAAKKEFDPILEAGGSWQLALERWFEARDDHYDVVIITGPPFPPFGFAAWAQRVWYARTVLDQTPVPEEASESAARELRKYWERGWNLAADVIAVPDGAAAERVAPTGPDARVEVLHDEAHPAAAALLLALADHSQTHPPSART